MKHRTLFSFGAAFGIVAAAAAAEVASENIFGILALNDTTSANLIISVPWVDCTDVSQGTLVSNVVKTTNLQVGDYIIRKSGSTYQSWVLTSGAGGNYWKPQIVVGAGVTTTTEGANTARMARGDALWLHRQNPAESSPIYLFGQYTSAGASTTIAAGTTTLAANPGDSAKSPNYFSWANGGPANGDKILVNTATGYRTYTYNGTKWTYVTKTQGAALPALPGTNEVTYEYTSTENDADAIPAGKGFWYQSATGAGTINW